MAKGVEITRRRLTPTCLYVRVSICVSWGFEEKVIPGSQGGHPQASPSSDVQYMFRMVEPMGPIVNLRLKLTQCDFPKGDASRRRHAACKGIAG